MAALGTAPGEPPGPPPGAYPGPYGWRARGYPAPGRRRTGLRWVFVGIGGAIVALGILLLLVSLYPPAFGLHSSSLFPFGGGFLGLILVLWGALLLARVAARASRGPGYGYGRPPGRRFDPAIMAARQRYARGEITREQFEQIVSDLRRPPGPLP